ncbi:MAG: hypothetical protein VYC34_01660 [Planctomycetota bacterium]|nr:hypothetical protein [Planctomycetota bacterium]
MARRTLTKVSTSDLQHELRRRVGRLQSLEDKRDKLLSDLAEIDSEIAALGGTTIGARRGRGAAHGRRKRPRNDMNLEDALAKVLKSKTMSVTEVADAVQKAGYRTTSSSFRTIVNQTLINSDKFKRVARGQYTAK